MEYPEQWPTFFHDLIAILPEGPDAVDMFCRVLIAVDQDVVSREIARLDISHHPCHWSLQLSHYKAQMPPCKESMTVLKMARPFISLVFVLGHDTVHHSA